MAQAIGAKPYMHMAQKNIDVNIRDVHDGRKEKLFFLGTYAFVCIVENTKEEGGKLKSYWPCTHTYFVVVLIACVCVSTQFKPEANGRCLFLYPLLRRNNA